jgi:hypothetical protein
MQFETLEINHQVYYIDISWYFTLYKKYLTEDIF